jgi:hypothetical protein
VKIQANPNNQSAAGSSSNCTMRPKTKSPWHTVVILFERDVGQQFFLCNFFLSEADLPVALRKAQHALASQV